jgi:hypothetical protein
MNNGRGGECPTETQKRKGKKTSPSQTPNPAQKQVADQRSGKMTEPNAEMESTERKSDHHHTCRILVYI